VKKNEGDALSYRQRRADYGSSSPTSYLESATELPQLLSDPTKSDSAPAALHYFSSLLQGYAFPVISNLHGETVVFLLNAY
jgi:hypothetical protein